MSRRSRRSATTRSTAGSCCERVRVPLVALLFLAAPFATLAHADPTAPCAAPAFQPGVEARHATGQAPVLHLVLPEPARVTVAYSAGVATTPDGLPTEHASFSLMILDAEGRLVSAGSTVVFGARLGLGELGEGRRARPEPGPARRHARPGEVRVPVPQDGRGRRRRVVARRATLRHDARRTRLRHADRGRVRRSAVIARRCGAPRWARARAAFRPYGTAK